jgi:CRP/FNR family nitrogen fixation transcriptional regulator
MPELFDHRDFPAASSRYQPAGVPISFATSLRRNFSMGDELFAEGDPSDYLYYVIFGTVRCSKILADGRRQLDTFFLAGDIFGLDGGGLRRFTVEAVEETVVTCLRLSEVHRLMDSDPVFRNQIVSSMGANLERARARTALLGRKTPRERLLAFLVEMKSRLQRTGRFDLPMHRTDIADHLGLAKETLSRTLTKLASEGLVVLGQTGRKITLEAGSKAA